MTAQLIHQRLDSGGAWVDATGDEAVAVINPATDEVTKEEIFGPVGVVIPFDGEDDAVAIANDTRDGLAASVSLNGTGGGPQLWGPFGGDKQSGIEREFGDDGLDEYAQLKTVSGSAGRP